jgi:hypothetical protein
MVDHPWFDLFWTTVGSRSRFREIGLQRSTEGKPKRLALYSPTRCARPGCLCRVQTAETPMGRNAGTIVARVQIGDSGLNEENTRSEPNQDF